MHALIILMAAFFMGLPVFALIWSACSLGAIFGTVLLPLAAIVAGGYLIGLCIFSVQDTLQGV